MSSTAPAPVAVTEGVETQGQGQGPGQAPEQGPEQGAAPVRWLTEEEQGHWRAFRDGTARLLDVLAHELDAGSGLSLHEYELLVRLSEAPGRTLRMSELAAGLAHSRSRLTHTVRRMESAGMVERRACASDARGVECVMTEQGWATLVAAAPGHVASVRAHLVDVLTPEQFRALGDAMRAVGADLDRIGCPVRATHVGG
ncbi:MarR family winged helix-turn-helix transcriptional regulator [Cellulomonas endophytica]|uniref:MarR family winged helix-turn-helix transcriptional regulator n=1 Tax=Cellulomonas endophytica TaxID=2494735 RepID=UPI001010E079|nr:MarR family winged helix-turn-helix transcriptional regulator [Cellulomonas endophytica]